MKAGFRTGLLILGLLTVVVGPSWAAGAADQTSVVDTLGPVQVGQPLPTFAGQVLTGEMVRWVQLIDPAAEPRAGIVVTVYASWCAPCRGGLETLRELSRKDPDLRVLLVNHKETEAKAAAYLMELGFTDPQFIMTDPWGDVSTRLGVTELPRTFLVDGRGVTHAIFTVEGKDFDEVLRRELAAMRRLNGPEGARAPGSASSASE